MSAISDRLADLNLTLPQVPKPAGSYVPAARHGSLVFTAGQLPIVDGVLAYTGLVGDSLGADVNIEQAYTAARLCALNALAAAGALIGGLEQIESIVKVTGFVASAPGFTSQPAVVNGASDLLAAIFGDSGRHARSAVGVAALPLGAPVEVELIVAIRGGGALS
jgi:enamine deaminase RidA (YjgF/YER057c/UK114 family)